MAAGLLPCAPEPSRCALKPTACRWHGSWTAAHQHAVNVCTLCAVLEATSSQATHQASNFFGVLVSSCLNFSSNSAVLATSWGNMGVFFRCCETFTCRRRLKQMLTGSSMANQYLKRRLCTSERILNTSRTCLKALQVHLTGQHLISFAEHGAHKERLQATPNSLWLCMLLCIAAAWKGRHACVCQAHAGMYLAAKCCGNTTATCPASGHRSSATTTRMVHRACAKGGFPQSSW